MSPNESETIEAKPKTTQSGYIHTVSQNEIFDHESTDKLIEDAERITKEAFK